MERRISEDPGIMYAINLCCKSNEFLIRCSTPAHAERLEHCLLSMWYEIQQENLCMNAYLHSLCTQFLVELNRSVSDSNIVSARLDHRRPLLEKSHPIFGKILVTDSHCKRLNTFCQPRHCGKSFSPEARKIFYQYVVEYRIAIAQSMIVQGYPLKDISSQCGFSDYSAFINYSKAAWRFPSEYRSIAPSNYFNN